MDRVARRDRGRVLALSDTTWLSKDELRVGLGCMRLSTDTDRDDERAFATIAAAAAAGITVFDTARSYGHGEHDLGHNERLLAAALRACGAHETAHIVTKGGMARPGGGWVADGRAKSIRADCEASLVALDGLAIDLYLIHTPDPRTPWRTSVRSLARLVEDGLVTRVGVSNVNRAQLDEALGLAPIAAVQVALSPFDDRAVRGGLLDRCEQAGVALIAHSPLGGPRRARTLDRHSALADVAEAHLAGAAEAALAWLLDLSPSVVAIPGARRPETARSAARAAAVGLTEDDRARLARSLGGRRPAAGTPVATVAGAEVVLVMGIPGAGKTRVAEEYVGRGYLRLNRDEQGGSLLDVAKGLHEALAAGERRVVLDNTYLTRAARSHVLDVATRHRLPTRCVWLDTPLAQAQVNMVERFLDHLGSLPSAEELKQLARRPGLLTPTSQMRAQRELEPPAADEGFATVERLAFERAPPPDRNRAAVFVAATALDGDGWQSVVAEATAVALLLFDWRPGGSVEELAEALTRVSTKLELPVEAAVCPHGGGAPTCWCRPPLPGLPLAFARAHRVDPRRSVLVGRSAAHRTLAATLGARFVAGDDGAQRAGPLAFRLA